MATNDTLLYCRSCKRLINSEVNRCPQCGAKDPFLVNQMMKAKLVPALFVGFAVFGIAMLICNALFIKHATGLVVYFCIMGSGFVGFIGAKIAKGFFGETKCDELGREMRDICRENHDMETYDKWREYVRKEMSFD